MSDAAGIRIGWLRPGTLPDTERIDDAGFGVGQQRLVASAPASRRPGMVAGRVLARRMLREAGDDGRMVAVCAWCGGEHGGLRSASGALLVSVAHAVDLVVVALAPAAVGRLGVDVEVDDEATRRRIAEAAERVGGAAAPRDVAAWTRYEAVVKADGRGLRLDPADLRWRRGRGGWTARLPDRPGALRVHAAPGPPGAVVSVAVGRR